MAQSGINGTGLTAATVGIIFMWSAVKGSSVTATIREIITGQQPSGQNVYPINAPSGGSVAPNASAGNILKIAASKKGQCYSFGAGHGNPCGSRCTDCSSYVSCVLSTALGKRIDMATAGLAKLGTGVDYSQRMPGDVIVWNGGTGGGHTGIIATVDGKGGTMWNNLCTGCGGVKLTRYPTGTRTAASAVVRRVTK